MKNINKHANRDFINNEAVIIVKCRNKCNNFLNFKFEFPGKNLNQSEKGFKELLRKYRYSVISCFLNSKLFT